MTTACKSGGQPEALSCVSCDSCKRAGNCDRAVHPPFNLAKSFKQRYHPGPQAYRSALAQNAATVVSFVIYTSGRIGMLRAAFNSSCRALVPRLFLSASRGSGFPRVSRAGIHFSRLKQQAHAGHASAPKPPPDNSATAPAVGLAAETSIAPAASSRGSSHATSTPAVAAGLAGDGHSMNTRARCPRGIIRYDRFAHCFESARCSLLNSTALLQRKELGRDGQRDALSLESPWLGS